MSSIKSFFDKYLPFPERKRKHSEDRPSDCAPKRKLPRLSLVRRGRVPQEFVYVDGERYSTIGRQPQHQSRLVQPVPALNPLPKPRNFFSGSSFAFRKPAAVISKHSSRYGMDSIDLESDEDVELVDFLQSIDVSPETFGKLSGRQNVARPLPALIPRKKTHTNGGSFVSQPPNSRADPSSSRSKGENGACSMNPYTLFKQRFNVASPQIRAQGSSARSSSGHHPMVVNSALQKSFALEEKQKYSDMCNGLAPSMGAHSRPGKSSEGSLFGALQRIPFTTRNTVNIGSRNRYGELLKKFSADIDPRRGLTSLRGSAASSRSSTCVDLTKNGTGAGVVELTDDEEEEEAIDLEADRNEVSFKIPKSFPCAHSLDNHQQQRRETHRSGLSWKDARAAVVEKSPRDILMALEKVDRDEEEEEDDDDDEDEGTEIMFRNPSASSVVLDYDDEQAATSSQASSSTSMRSGQRAAEKVAPVNSLLDEWHVKPVFKDDWLEMTRRRYSMKQDQWSARIAEQQQQQEELERENRENMQDMIKKMDEAMLLREVVVVEDEEEAQKELAKAQQEQDTPLPVFNADQTSLIRYAAGRGSPDEVLITKFNLSITRRDIATLLGDSWLNDEVINFYMNLLMERSESGGGGYPKCYAMNTFFMPKVLQQGQSAVRRWTRKVDIFAFDVIPVPVHVSNIHWCMAIISLKERYIRYYDSMGQPNKRVLDALEQYLRDESMDKRKVALDMEGWRKENIADCPRQMNGSDCGVFSCMFAEYISRGHRVNFTQENMPYFRQKMILEICAGKLLL